MLRSTRRDHLRLLAASTLALGAARLTPLVTKADGVIIVEPWVRPEEWKDGTVHALFVDQPEMKVARMSVSRRDGNVSVLNFHYMIASRDGIRTFTEPHRLTLFTAEQYHNAFRKAGLFVEFDEHGFSGRGLYVGFSRAE